MNGDDELTTGLDWDLLSDAVGAVSLGVLLWAALFLPGLL